MNGLFYHGAWGGNNLRNSDDIVTYCDTQVAGSEVLTPTTDDELAVAMTAASEINSHKVFLLPVKSYMGANFLN